jgi:hypothetical protein
MPTAPVDSNQIARMHFFLKNPQLIPKRSVKDLTSVSTQQASEGEPSLTVLTELPTGELT